MSGHPAAGQVACSEVAGLLAQALNLHLASPMAAHDGGDSLTVTTPRTGQVFTVTVTERTADPAPPDPAAVRAAIAEHETALADLPAEYGLAVRQSLMYGIARLRASRQAGGA
jgi:hypothetical protein